MTGELQALVAEAEGGEALVDPRAVELERQRLHDKLKVIIGVRQNEADRRVGARQAIEQRWLSDLHQYHGKYENEGTQTKETVSSGGAPPAKKKHGQRSQLFSNLTRPKTNGFAARLHDMLFPTDEDNWDIRPTPVATLSSRAEHAAKEAASMTEEANKALEAGEAEADPTRAAQMVDAGKRMLAAGNEFAAAARLVASRQEEARRRNDAMQTEMKDHLVECQFAAESRKAIMDACKIGTGVMKGPVRNMRMKRRWAEEDIKDATGKVIGRKQVSREIEDAKPALHRVSPWGWFPEPEASETNESEDFYERHLMTRKQLRKLARVEGFDPEAIRRVLTQGPQKQVPQYIHELKSINDLTIDTKVERFIVWEWYGSLTAEEVTDLCACLGQDDMGADYAEADPLVEVPVCLWFCQGEVFKLGDYHLDSGDPLYSSYCIEPDEASIWGYGIPYIINHPQRALNSGWRMMLDNLGLAAGPQIVIDTELVEPADDDWTMAPMKVWKAKKGAVMTENQSPFRIYNIDSHQADMSALIKMAEAAIDKESDFPLIAQGESGPHISQTLGGMSILMNSANVVLRRVIKAWDDNMTVPMLTRLYDWLMQFSLREDIKGDFEVSARGSSVLLVRELQTQNLMLAAQTLSANPLIRPMIEDKLIFTVRRLYQSMMLNPDEHVATEEEWRQKLLKLAAMPPPIDPETAKFQNQIALYDRKHAGDMELAQLAHETAMMETASRMNMKLDELMAMLQKAREDRAHKERMLAGEIGAERVIARDALAAGRVPQGSGGMVSA